MRKKQPGRPLELPKVLEKFKKRGVFRTADAIKTGISQPSLSRLVSEGKVTRLGTGFYIHPESSLAPEERDYAVACAKFGPKSVIGGMTALFHYNLIEQVPHRVWVMVPYTTRTTHKLYRCIRTKTNFAEGIEVYRTYRITNLERTLVEAFRYASKIGLRLAFHATRTALREKRTTLEKIHRRAKKLNLEKFIERHWEALVAEAQAV